MFKPTTEPTPRRTPSCPELLRALADETRLAIVRVLLEAPRRVFEINAVLDVEPSLLSHHLRALRESGLVQAERDGKSMRYSLSPQVENLDRMGVDLGCCRLTFR